MKKYSRFLIISLSCCLFMPLGCRQRQSDDIESKLDAVFRGYNRSIGPGCAVGIVDHGKIVFQKGYGMASLEYSVAITPATIFDIASVSKQFTGLAISRLIQEKKIYLDDDIHKYLPDVPQFGRAITIRHLLHHMSGIRDWPQTLNAAGWRWDEVFSFADIMRMVAHQKDLDFDPGTKFSYSNTGYNLLAAIVEKVTGGGFRQWTDSTIFKPLGMGSSHFSDDYTQIIRNLACSYDPQGNEFRKIPGELTAYGSSSLFTSVEDLCKWVINFQKMVDSGDSVYLRMMEDGVLNNGEKVHYGYGLGTNEDRGLKNISHTGGWAGYRTIISNYPDQKLSIIILSNSSDFDPQTYAARVADIFLKGKFKNVESNLPDYKNMATLKVDTLLMKKYTGTYQLGPGWVVTLTVENGQLMTQANGEDKFPTAAKSDSVFWIDAYGTTMTFELDKDGEVNLLKYKGIQAKKIVPWIPDPKIFPQYAGTYFSEELLSEYKIDIKNNKILMHHMRIGDFELSPDLSGQEQFSGKIGTIQFFRNDQQTVTGFKLSGGRVQNILFDKK